MYVNVPHVCMVFTGVRSLETLVIDGCKQLCRCWGLNREERQTAPAVFQVPIVLLDSCQGDTNPYVTSHGCGLSTFKVELIC